jgi:hypothetical protein
MFGPLAMVQALPDHERRAAVLIDQRHLLLIFLRTHTPAQSCVSGKTMVAIMSIGLRKNFRMSRSMMAAMR